MMTLAEHALTKTIIACFYRVYDGLGYGFLESVYRRALAVEFRLSGISAVSEAPFDVWYRNDRVGRFRGDFLVERRAIVEVKASQTLALADRKQLLNYLRASPVEVGLLLHFGPKAAFERFIYSNAKKGRMAAG
jgi:GxxExxY protein